MSHEGSGWLERLNVIRNAWQHGDWFPLWWKDGSCGLGSPMPLLYHKLFNFLAAPLCALAGSVKGGIVLALISLSIGGIYGLRALCVETGARGRSADVVALVFPHVSYAATDWLVRGAFAEYAGMAAGVWLLAWCQNLVRTGHPRATLVPIVALCFLAHSVVALYGGLFIAIAAAIVLMTAANKASLLRRLLSLGVGTLVVLSPLLILMGAISKRANTGYLAGDVYHPTKQFIDLSRYIHDKAFVWGADWRTFTVQFDLALTISLGVAVLAFLATWPRHWTDVDSQQRRSAFFLIGSLVVVALLQSRVAGPFYTHVPGAALLQFPWRLLGYATPIALALLSWLYAALESRVALPATRLALVTTVALITTSAVQHPIRYDWLGADVLVPQRMPQANEWREYWPGAPGGSPQVEAYIRDLAHQGVADVGAKQCEGREQATDRYLTHEYVVHCEGPSVVAVPVASYGLALVRSLGPRGERLEASTSITDPRLRIRLSGGDYVIRVELPTLWRLVGRFIGF
jgi:hypothetical protein